MHAKRGVREASIFAGQKSRGRVRFEVRVADPTELWVCFDPKPERPHPYCDCVTVEKPNSKKEKLKKAGTR